MSSYKQNKQIYSTYSAYYQRRILHKMNRKSVLIEMLKCVLSFSIPLLVLLDRCNTKHEHAAKLRCNHVILLEIVLFLFTF